MLRTISTITLTETFTNVEVVQIFNGPFGGSDVL